MKTRTKLVLGASCLSCAALAGLGSSTFAWFVTQNNVSITHSQLVISTTNPSLELTVTRLVPTAAETLTVTASETISDQIDLSDISSKFGETFYKKADSGDNYYDLIPAESLSGSVLQYGVKVSTLAMKRPMNLSIRFSIAGANLAATNNVRNWVRTAVYECTDETYAERLTTGKAVALMYKKTQQNCDKYVSGTSESDVSTYTAAELQQYGNQIDLKENIVDASVSFYKISVWLEGTAATNQDIARGATFSVSTAFALNVPSL